MLQRYPKQEDWHRVRFSDESHFGLGPPGRIRVWRKTNERYCKDCLDEVNTPKDSDFKILHAWGAIGYNFKSNLIFYNIESNSNGKMTQQDYINQIPIPEVMLWQERGEDYVLEQDGDSGHGPSKDNIVRQFKEQYSIEHFFNCRGSPDLSPIENAWFPIKHGVRKMPHWDPNTTRELALESWKSLSQATINKWIESMPARLQKVIDNEGRMTGY
jgi:2-hydroxy-3-keto-5-methylthiopentenyl-1-phosphate phosphatase